MLSFLPEQPRSGSAVRRLPRLVLERLEERTVPAATEFFTPSKIGIVRPTSTGVAVFALDSNGNGTYDPADNVFHFGLNSDKFLVGDWDGDGTDKIGVVRPHFDGTNAFALDSNGNGGFDGGDKVFTFGLSSDLIVVGDWNGDGRAKIGVVRFGNSGGATISLDSNGNGTFDAGDKVFGFGQTGDKFIVGDWDGDGKATIGVVRNDGRGGAIVIFDSYGIGAGDPNNARFPFGAFADTFIVGDWNGDGRSKVGVVRPNASGVASFSLDSNGNGGFDGGDRVFSFGLNTDTFLVGKWKATPTPITSTPVAPVTPAVQPAGPTLQGLTLAQLQPLIQAAIDQWRTAGLSAQHLQQLQQAQIRITQLSGALAITSGSQISLDSTATGLNWFIDPTPNTGEEFPTLTAKGWQAFGGTAAGNSVDLVTVLAHEMGHVLGLGHLAKSDNVMVASVGPGYRRMPTSQDVALVPPANGNTGPSFLLAESTGTPCGCSLCRGAI